MNTLYDLAMEIARIRDAVNAIEVKGRQNASLVTYAFDKCNGLIQMINEATKELESRNKEAEENQNGTQEADQDGDLDGP